MISFAFFTRSGLRFGATVLAANVVLLNLQETMAYGMDGFCNAAEAFVGEAIGKKDPALFIAVLKSTGMWCGIAVVVFTLLYAIGGRAIVNLLTSITSVRVTAYHYLIFLVIGPMASAWGFWLDGVFIGATQSKLMRNSMLLAMLTFFVAYFAFYSLGNTGLWMAFTCFMAARAVAMAPFLPRIYRSISLS